MGARPGVAGAHADGAPRQQAAHPCVDSVRRRQELVDGTVSDLATVVDADVQSGGAHHQSTRRSARRWAYADAVSYRIRAVRPADADALPRLQVWQPARSAAEAVPLVAEDEDGASVGFVVTGAAVDDHSGIAELYALEVASDHWGCGAGCDLLATAVDQLYRAGFDRVVLWIDANNVRRSPLLRAARVVGRHPRTARNPVPRRRVPDQVLTLARVTHRGTAPSHAGPSGAARGAIAACEGDVRVVGPRPEPVVRRR